MTGQTPDAVPAFDQRVRDLETTFSTLMRQYRQLMALQAEALEPGLSAGAFKAFVIITHTAPVTPSALAEQLLMDRPQVSRFVRDLDAAGLIERQSDPQDRRSIWLAPSPDGVARLEAVRSSPAGGGLRRDLAAWDLGDIENLTGLLNRLITDRRRRSG
ncbi:MAG: MarR family transcriptional regulator [Micrococcus sp.]|nr:MarR family transcriptional regulator [Micrococcus sp.]